jgi:hypothetical protein
MIQPAVLRGAMHDEQKQPTWSEDVWVGAASSSVEEQAKDLRIDIFRVRFFLGHQTHFIRGYISI